MPSVIQVVGPTLVFFVCVLCPESPRVSTRSHRSLTHLLIHLQWLIRHQREEEAIEVLARYHANGDRNDPLVLWELDGIRTSLISEEMNQQARYIDFLKTPGNRRRLAVLISLCLGLNWVGNGIIA